MMVRCWQRGHLLSMQRIQPYYAIRARAYFGRFNLLLLVLQIGLRYTGRDLESVYQTLHFFRK